MKNVIVKSIGLSSISLGGYVVIDEDRRRYAKRVSEAAIRITNLTSTVGVILIDYGFMMYKVNNSNSEKSLYEKYDNELKSLQAQQEISTLNLWQSKSTKDKTYWENYIKDTRKQIDTVSEKIGNLQSEGIGSVYSEVHKRSSIRLRDMCAQNKGVYIKLGQHIAMLDHVIPSEYQETLSTLLSKTPTSSIDSVRRVIYEDLGQYPETLFHKFEPIPIASASLAQVHVAYDKDGNKYAVKVQHEGLRDGATGDMIAITFLVNLVSNIFEGFSYKWLASEMNKNLPKELDFLNEKKNLERCRVLLSNLIKSGDVAVPVAFNDKSSSRVLTMKFESGSYVTDLDSIYKQKLNPAHVARLISITFCEQIFRHGFVHCDPHDANLLVRENPLKKGKPQIVLLDHGLYKELDDSLRKDYCRLWRALVSGDEPTIKLYCEKLGAGKAFTLLAAMLTMRPWDDIVSDDMGRLKSKNTKGEQEMLKAYARRYFKDITILLNSLPTALLLVLKTNDCLRHLDRKLGAPINTASVVAEITADVIYKEDMDLAFKSKESKLINITNVLLAYSNVMLRVGGLYFISLTLEARKYIGFWTGIVKRFLYKDNHVSV